MRRLSSSRKPKDYGRKQAMTGTMRLVSLSHSNLGSCCAKPRVIADVRSGKSRPKLQADHSLHFGQAIHHARQGTDVAGCYAIHELCVWGRISLVRGVPFRLRTGEYLLR